MPYMLQDIQSQSINSLALLLCGFSHLNPLQQQIICAEKGVSCTQISWCTHSKARLTNWLKWLLSKSDIEEAINRWSNLVRNSNSMYDVQHGTSFKNIDWDDKPNSLNIVQSMFIDWFNSQGLKIDGKTESTGVITFTCINLPPEIQNKPSNICLAPISPGTNSTNPQTSTI
ncbi:hypothetical protein VP01_1095g8 [Puccinia sorghi]|uniref:Uncharacterized protein n=1 Tax=Puccinia sorghi TaxID=27349 RepID=A0A0L6VT14_9BASI|nr:hypothetical protein VP01_1095g8 [Puccinia sorghi]